MQGSRRASPRMTAGQFAIANQPRLAAVTDAGNVVGDIITIFDE